MKKIIHYFFDDINIWQKGKSTSFTMCYASWKKACPDYEIKLWHDKMPEFQDMLRRSRFLQECYKRKMWAFVSDYVRYYALYKYGGIYLDTDVQLIKNFDNFLDKPFFCSIEGDIHKGKNVPEPAVMGGEEGHIIFKKVLDLYNSEEIFDVDYLIAPIVLQKVLSQITYFSIINYIDEYKICTKKYYNENVKLRVIRELDVYKNQKPFIDLENGIYIYPSEYFCPTWVVFGEKAFTQNTVAIHWNQSSWYLDKANNKLREVESFKYKNPFKRFLYVNSSAIAKNLLILMPRCWLKEVWLEKISDFLS